MIEPEKNPLESGRNKPEEVPDMGLKAPEDVSEIISDEELDSLKTQNVQQKQEGITGAKEELDNVFKDEEKKKNPEIIPTREQVLEIVAQFAEKYEISRELSNEQGLYLLEAVVENEKGEKEEYLYLRKGDFGKNKSAKTEIHAVYYDGDMPVGGDLIASLNEETGQWENIK